MSYVPPLPLDPARIASLEELVGRCDDGTGSHGINLFRRPGDGGWCAEITAPDDEWTLLGTDPTRPDLALADLAGNWSTSRHRVGDDADDPWASLHGLDPLEQRRMDGDR